jgi:hypothetical protein
MTSIFDIVATVVILGAAFWAIKWALNRYGLVRA